MITEPQLFALLGLIVVVWIVLMTVGGVSVSSGMLGPVATIPTVVLLVLAAFNRWLWRIRWLYPWLVQTPNLSGTWKGRFESSFVPSGSANSSPETAEAYLVIRQTFSTVHASLITEKSLSKSLVCRIVRAEDGSHELMGAYLSVARPQFREESPTHYGGLLLRVVGDKDPVLIGEYWTDRRTRGELSFRSRSRDLAGDWEAARGGDYRSPKT